MRRDDIATPALVLDHDALCFNVGVMTRFAKERGIGLRPHAKSHKSVDIARLLCKAGAIGACCATIGEAEALAAGGIEGLLITSPVVTQDGLKRLSALLFRSADVMVVADDVRNVPDLARIAAASGRTLPVLVEIDVGVGRTGAKDLADGFAVAKCISAEPALRFGGVQAYWGNLQQVMPFEARSARVAEQATKLRQFLGELSKAGLEARIVTGGGTGTHWLDAELGLFTELQVGSFLFLDSCYGAVPLTPLGNPFTPSLFVAASVVSAAAPGRVIVNAGLKAFATDSGKPVPMRGAPAGSTYRFMGDEHGAIDFAGEDGLEPGAVIELLTSHCDPTVNLHHCYHVVKGEHVIDRWPISARGYEALMNR